MSFKLKPVYRGSKEARERLGDIGNTKFFEEIRAGRLVVSRVGRVLLLTEERAREFLRQAEGTASTGKGSIPPFDSGSR